MYLLSNYVIRCTLVYNTPHVFMDIHACLSLSLIKKKLFSINTHVYISLLYVTCCFIRYIPYTHITE